uniref:Secreted protein n=1 Tax=Arundo donax TaxID=35708 RepID=A0A0A8Z4J4_ARUDO
MHSYLSGACDCNVVLSLLASLLSSSTSFEHPCISKSTTSEMWREKSTFAPIGDGKHLCSTYLCYVRSIDVVVYCFCLVSAATCIGNPRAWIRAPAGLPSLADEGRTGKGQ